ncbi:MAG: DUF1819 family protein [Hyphomicrobiales bacterium]|nr:DUF1819 family protein [Hyphomicrobiales bacterium]
MTTAQRTNVVSSFTIIKGAMISETYEVLSRWDFEVSKKANLDRLRDENYIGASSSTWLRDVAKVLNRRLDPEGRDRPLAVLAKGGCALDEWKPALLWHITRDEFLLKDFLVHWLFPEYVDGAFRAQPDSIDDYLRDLGARGGQTEHEWTDSTRRRVAAGLLKISADFGLLAGGAAKEFTAYHLPDRSLIYLLHASLEQEDGSPRRVLDSDDWRMFLLATSDLEAELLRLHQFHQLGYQAAGSLVELTLPCDSPLSYAKEMVA